MNRYLIGLLYLLVGGAQVSGQGGFLDIIQLADSLRKDAHTVVQRYDVHYEVTSPRTATIRYAKVVTLLNDRHPGGNVVTEYYDDDTKLTQFDIRGEDPSGEEIFRSSKKNTLDQRQIGGSTFDSDAWTRRVEVPCTRYPCTLTIEVEKKMTDFGMMNFPRWMPGEYGESVRSASFTATVPLSNTLLYQASELADPTVTTDDKTRTYRWTLADRPATNSEPYSPSPWETLPRLLVTLENFQVDAYTGSYRDWNSFGSFIGELMKDRDRLPASLASEVHELVADAATRRDTIDRLYRFMQGRCRYVSIQLGIGGWQPFSAEYVDENRYGDCKALSNYMGAMLREVGIESYPVLVNRSDRPSLDVCDNFAISWFNHMVLYVPSEAMYLECTSTDEPTGYLSDDKEDRNVVWITPQGGRLARTPGLLPADHGHLRTVALELTDNDAVGFTLDATYYGASQETFRAVASYFGSDKDRREWLHSYDYLPDVTGTKYRYEVASERPKVHMEYETELNDRVRKMGSRRFFSVNPFPLTEIPDQVPDRRLPVDYANSRFFVDTVYVSYPGNLEIESGLAADPIVYEHAVGSYRAEMRGEEAGKVTWIRTLKLKPARLPAEAYGEFRQFFVDVAKAEGLQLVFREKRTK